MGSRRHNKKGRSNREGQYWLLPYSMARHPQFRSLSGSALKVLVELHCRFNGSNNGNLTLSLREICDLLGMGKETARRAYEELEQKGFIQKTQAGHFYGRRATEWAVTDEKLNDNNATRDWQKKPINSSIKKNPRF
ncbi:helix-turn-helix domain-containing protein [uncultured Cohaesibacter sp.]|uniref:helix-turn-helix domain-containing protein n=1 Tax=uncultured Cohaesibacter sp. TaxID=1002546 RepID=UPI00292CE2A4|nr:helix-turn-helix domain-containing protein [uncultured Cohaesibacter sp.]